MSSAQPLMKVLIVEDDPASFHLLEFNLTELKIPKENMVWTQYLKSAELLLETYRFDLIFLDLSLPDSIEGDTLQFIKKYPQVKIVIFTANEDQRIIMECMRSGAIYTIPKDTFRIADLERALSYARA